jgi:predicted HAD superfamily Cof-like phosphohydrolase
MNTQLQQVIEFHQKFNVELQTKPTPISSEQSLKRYKFMREEVEEYLEGAEANDLPNIAKELCDILYTTYGTIIAHGLQDIIDDVFTEVHRSNMSKEYHPYKIRKGKDYTPAAVKQFFVEPRQE